MVKKNYPVFFPVCTALSVIGVGLDLSKILIENYTERFQPN